MAVDTLGHLLALQVTPTSAEDRGEVERLYLKVLGQIVLAPRVND